MHRIGRKVVILGAGNVGATIAFVLAANGGASTIVLIDINKEKAKGEAMDITQGATFCPSSTVIAGEYEDAAGADIVIITVGVARKPGMTRLDLAQTNVGIVQDVMPQIAKHAPNAVYVVVSNPVDILTYAIAKTSGIDESRVIGSGTLLDSTRLRSSVAAHVGVNTANVHAYVLGEHGDTAIVPWSLATIGGMRITDYCDNICERENQCAKAELDDIINDVKTSGAQVIASKGATYYAIALSVARICDHILRDANAVLLVSAQLHGQYGIHDVCLSLPFVVGRQGIKRVMTPILTAEEERQLHHSADSLKAVIKSCIILNPNNGQEEGEMV